MKIIFGIKLGLRFDYVETVRYDNPDITKGKEREVWKYSEPYALSYNHNPMVNNTSGSVVGYKYFNLNETFGLASLRIVLTVVPLGVDGEITVIADSPWEECGGKKIAAIPLSRNMEQEKTTLSADVTPLTTLKGRHAIFLRFSSRGEKEASLCNLHTIGFKSRE